MNIFNQKLDHIILSKMAYLNSLGIKEFGYRQFHSSGKTVGYCSQLKWNKFVEQQNFFKEMSFYYSKEINNLLEQKQKYCLRTGKRVKTSFFLEALYNHGLWNTLVVYKYNTDKIEGYYFISSLENDSIVNFYLNRLDLFEQFVNAVQLPINSIFSLEGNNNLMVNIEAPNFSTFNSRDSEVNTLLRSIKPEFINFSYNGSYVRLSKKEIEYLLLTALGYNNKEIGGKLTLSLRTVEKYSSQIKIKFNFNTRSQLIKFVYDSQLSLLIKDIT